MYYITKTIERPQLKSKKVNLITFSHRQNTCQKLLLAKQKES